MSGRYSEDESDRYWDSYYDNEDSCDHCPNECQCLTGNCPECESYEAECILSENYCDHCNECHEDWKSQCKCPTGYCEICIEKTEDPATLYQKARRLQENQHWTRLSHHKFSPATKKLFSTLFLGIQRLEDTAGLPLAHQAMLEEMLECWTKSDDFLIWHRWMLDY